MEERMQSHAILLASAVALVGCMTTSPSSFEAVQTPSYFVLTEDAEFPNKIAKALGSGRYSSIFAKNGITYYLGEPKALIMPNGVRVNGGIAIDAALSNCHLFIQVGDDSKILQEQGAGVVVSQLAKLEAGRIRDFPNDAACKAVLPKIAIQKP
jgi:hypothetical protein